MTGLRYHVAAMSMPMVYTLDGDHDRDGLLFALDAHRPLLEWAKARWEEDGERLPRLHFRRQRAQLVVDGLDRLDGCWTGSGTGPTVIRTCWPNCCAASTSPSTRRPRTVSRMVRGAAVGAAARSG